MGNWASGSTVKEMSPANAITMDSTDAKIGRSMKKREITVVVLVAWPV